MRLMTKTALVIAAALALATMANVALLQTFVQPTFLDLDRTHSQEDQMRALDAIAVDLKNVSDKTQDWSHWDDLYTYAISPSSKFTDDNLQPEHMVNMGMATGMVVDLNYKIQFQVNSNKGNALPPLFSSTHLPDGLRAKFAANEFVGKAAVILAEGKMHLAAIAPIVKSDGSGPPVGYIVFARPADAAYVTSLAERIKVNVKLDAPERLQPRGSTRQADRRDTSSGETPNFLTQSGEIKDHAGIPAMKVVTQTPRDVKKLGVTVLLWTSAGLILIGILATIGGAGMMNRMVISPVSRIAAHMVRLGKTSDLTARLDETRRDEIGALAKQLNLMAEELDTARKTLVDQTYASGMSEMAADVLHNVRNAMNPIGVRVWSLKKTLTEGVSDNLKRAVTELAGETLQLERRRKLGEYATSAIDDMIKRREQSAKEFSEIITAAKHIEDVLRDFDQVSMGPRQYDRVSIVDITSAANALAGCFRDSGSHTTVAIEPGLSELPDVRGSRVVLQQVISNLLKNAEEAVLTLGQDAGKITISGDVVKQETGDVVEIVVSDNGTGIPSDQLETIFARGHSSKSGGNRGLGLHWCANSLKTMGGSIHVSSAGAGQGSSFYVRMPVYRPEQEVAA
ncbi:MAG: CHASE4 domain-containing protein [Micropepsaceae bacterium]